MKPSIERPWMKHMATESPADVPFCSSAYLAIEPTALDRPHDIAATYYGRNTTYEQLLKRIDQFASAFLASGVKKGEIVTPLLLNSPDAIAVFYALNKIGAVANLVSGLKAEQDLIHSIVSTDTRYVITLDLFLPKIEKIRSQLPCVEKIIVTNITCEMSFVTKHMARILKKQMPLPLPKDTVYTSLDHFLATEEQPITTASDPDAPAALIYTSGTTGGSKGVVLTNRMIAFTSAALMQMDCNYKAGKTFLDQIPLFVVSGLIVLVQCCLMKGVRLLIRLPGQESLEQLLKLKPNYVMSYPEDYYEFHTDVKRDLSFLEEISCGSDFISEAKEKELNQYFADCGSSAILKNCYGLTEGTSAVTLNTNRLHKFGSVGIPLGSSIISTFDPDTGEEMDCGQAGEICIHSLSVMKEYYGHPVETAQALRVHSDGRTWLHTGDLGYIDTDGFLFITGRLKRNMAVRIGSTYERIFSADVESVLRKHPGVLECFVVPKEDNEKVYLPVAFIRYSGHPDLAALADDLKEYSLRCLDEFHRPGMYVFTNHFPLTSAQKVAFYELELIASKMKLTEWTAI